MQILFHGAQGPADTLRFMEEKTIAGLWSLDLRTSAMEWSPGMFALLGLEADQVRPSYGAITSLIHPEDQPVARDIEQSVRAGVPFDRVFRIIRQNGRLRWLLNRGETLFNAAGHAERAIGVMQDVTGHREALQSLQMCGERFRSLTLAANAMVWRAGADGQVTEVSRPAETNGTSLIEFAREFWYELVHPDDLPGTLDAWRAAVAARAPFAHEHRLRGSSGTYRWHRSRATPVMKNGSAAHKWVGASIDIHEQKTWSGSSHGRGLVTGAQIRAGRGILKWSVRDLAERSGISPGVIRRIEDQDGALEAADNVVESIRAALAAAGVEFLVPPDGKPAVRAS